MAGTDIVNRDTQFLIRSEEIIHTDDIMKRMCCTVLGPWMANVYGMTMKHFDVDTKRGLSVASSTEDIIIQSLFPVIKNTLNNMRNMNNNVIYEMVPDQANFVTVPCNVVAVPVPLTAYVD
jgi:hypothetical protein